MNAQVQADVQHAMRQATSDAALIDRLHTAEARCAILESKWASVPWQGISDMFTFTSDRFCDAAENTNDVWRWLNANRPQEAQP